MTKYERSYDLVKWAPISLQKIKDIARDNVKDVDLFIEAIHHHPIRLSPGSWVREVG